MTLTYTSQGPVGSCLQCVEGIEEEGDGKACDSRAGGKGQLGVMVTMDCEAQMTLEAILVAHINCPHHLLSAST